MCVLEIMFGFSITSQPATVFNVNKVHERVVAIIGAINIESEDTKCQNAWSITFQCTKLDNFTRVIHLIKKNSK